MTTKFSYQHDINGYFEGALPISDTKYSATLATSTATALTVPSTSGMGANGITSKTTQWVALIVCTQAADVWMSNGGTAAAPAGASFVGATSMLIPEDGALIYVKGGDILSFFTAGTSINVSVQFFSIS